MRAVSGREPRPPTRTMSVLRAAVRWFSSHQCVNSWITCCKNIDREESATNST